MATSNPGTPSPDDVILEDLPEGVQETMKARDDWFKTLPRASNGEEFLVAELQKWRPGQTIRVAFLGGSPELHRDIADAVAQISAACNLRFDFGFDPATGAYRSWSEQDTEYQAEIRVSFDHGGYWSLVGTDSVNAAIGRPSDRVGGRPHQRSLNLGGFHVHRPADWRGTTRHEFLHAIAFHHEHQNLNGPCQNEFRWEDDPGYIRTTNGNGSFVADSQGRRPGIYTYLSGPPNGWSKAKIDHNLRPAHGPVTPGQFDAASVMLYRFPPLFYKTSPSPCAPQGDGQSLSAGDRDGLQLLYPAVGGKAKAGPDKQAELLYVLEGGAQVQNLGLESMAPADQFRAAAAGALRAALQ